LRPGMMRAVIQPGASRCARCALLVVPCLVALALLWHASQHAAAHEAGVPSRLDFVPPKPGTYILQKIMRAPEGTVLDTNGSRRKLSAFTTGKVTVLSFIYTTCTDANGCPLALAILHDLRQQLEKTAAFRDKVRLVSLSFDPEHDTPEVMRLYGGNPAANSSGLQWYFLTTPSSRELLPLLDGFGQDVSLTADPGTGKSSRVYVHVLKVFLIDRKGQIREIYTTSFLLPQMMINDIKTLLLEDRVRVE
jgi:protein SCO1